MDQRERLRAEIDHATSDLVAKVNSLEDRAVEVRDRIQRSFELEHHAHERPWTVFGAAVATGMVLGLIFG